MEHAFSTGDRYVGEVNAEGKREGRGTYYFANGDVYVGEFRNNVFHGVGSLKRGSFKEGGRQCTGRSYQGDFAAGLREGRGRFATGFGDFYDGAFQKDLYHGEGSMTYANGDHYDGAWAAGRREGHGKMVYANRDVYEGEWKRGAYHGEGTMRYVKAGGRYAGSWAAGRMHGIGQRVYGSGAEYEGEFVEGVRQGKGVHKSAMGDLYVGHFVDDKFHGEGTLIMCTGDRYQGQFARGAFAGVGRYEYERGGYYEGEYLAMHRVGVELAPPPRWFWKAWNFVPKSHIYDPVTGELLMQNGKKYKKGDPVEPEVDPKKYPPSKRFEQAATEMRTRREARAAEKAAFERSIEYLQGEARDRAIKRFFEKHNKRPEAFRPPMLVGGRDDELYQCAGGRGDTALVLAADGKRHGRGVRVFPDGSRYEGDWFQDLCHGFGVFVGGGPLGVRYEGQWLEGKRHGVGVESYGHNGNGRCVCPLGGVHQGGARCFYDGAWEDNYFHGEGTFTCADGRQYNGTWQRGKRHGFGRFVMLPASLQYAVARDVNGQIVLQGVVEKGEFGQAVTFDDQYRIKVHEGWFNKNKRMGLGRETLNRGDVREGVFYYGRLNGIVRITFNTGKVSFAQFSYGDRRGWVRGAALRDLEDGWAEETKALREDERKAKRALELLEKLNMFGMSGASQKAQERKQIAEALEDEMTNSRAKRDAKRSAAGANAGAGILALFSEGGEDRV